MENPEKIEIRFNILDAAMKLGLMLGIYQIAKLAILVVAVKGSTVASLVLVALSIGVPVFLWWLVKAYRDRNCRLLFPFPMAWLTSVLTCLFASVIAGVATFAYLQYLDGGAFAADLMAQIEGLKQAALETATETEGAGDVQQYVQQLEAMGKLLAQMTPRQAVLQLFNNNLFWGNLFSVAVGLATSTYALFKKK
ncbi:MAG: DUF4199 domain-containing protein [Bacteroidaceae bacterium]|nr:DUF4199 domain-containing protein [Bacteroidaceae bacterium]